MNASHIPLSYEALQLIWWALLGILLIGFAVLDGFDMGMAILLPFVARKDTERRIMLNTVGPFWEGNQVWFILGGGAVFAAFPELYAVAFSGFYFAMLLVLAALILRPVGFDYRSKLKNPTWRSVWDGCLFIGGLVPSLVFGVAFGNLFEGVPFKFDEFMRVTYTGTLFDLLNPFALLCGIVSVLMLATHGATYLMLKTDDIVAARARKAAVFLPLLLSVGVLAGALWGAHYGTFYGAPVDGDINFVAKGRTWWSNYEQLGALRIFFQLALFLPLLTSLLAYKTKPRLAFAASAASIASIITNAGLTLFPFLLPSSLDPRSSLTMFNASSSHLTLFIMLLATVIFLPIIASYTIWGYYKMRGKITAADVENPSGHFY